MNAGYLLGKIKTNYVVKAGCQEGVRGVSYSLEIRKKYRDRDRDCDRDRDRDRCHVM